MSGPLHLTPGMAVAGISRLVSDLKKLGGKDEERHWPSNPEELPLERFDSGCYVLELVNSDMLPKKFDGGLTKEEQAASRHNPESILQKAHMAANRIARIEEGTWRGTRLALNSAYTMIETKYSSFMDTANFEPTVPSPLTLEQKRTIFKFTMPSENPSGTATGNTVVDSSDNYPPHLSLGGKDAMAPDQKGGMTETQGLSLSPGEIFNKMRIAQLSTLLPAVVPKNFKEAIAGALAPELSNLVFGGMGRPDEGKTLADVEKYNNDEHNKAKWRRKDIFDLPNIGNLPDWYSDARFAQQFFTGGDPTTITKAGKWTQIFLDQATAEDKKMKDKIESRKNSLYVQDYSYIRKVAGYDEKQPMFQEPTLGDKKQAKKYAVASVCLLNLTDSGKLEPLAIIIDWRGSAKDSVFIYNKELNTAAQKQDWPWRYAKTAVMVSDWVRHNVTTHLCRTHLIEEAVIVSAHRNLPQDHDVFQLLYPHWQKTLSLNAAARATLVPMVVGPLVGMEPARLYQYLMTEYKSFDFVGSYIPNDLKARGFPPEQLDDPKFHNYAWARCIHSMWYKIRNFVEDMLTLRYQGSDAEVQKDEHVQNWSSEMRAKTADNGSGASVSSFPEIKTFEALVDAVTMCIHIASPQHTSVNYLQNYYQAFVPNKPASLFAEPPATRQQLARFVEKDLVAALPMNHPHDWLLSSHIPYLLSFKPGDKESLIIYAASKYHVYKNKTDNKGREVAVAANKFYASLANSEQEFKKYGQDTDDHDTIVYDVLSPEWNAVSILI